MIIIIIIAERRIWCGSTLDPPWLSTCNNFLYVRDYIILILIRTIIIDNTKAQTELIDMYMGQCRLFAPALGV